MNAACAKKILTQKIMRESFIMAWFGISSVQCVSHLLETSQIQHNGDY